MVWEDDYSGSSWTLGHDTLPSAEMGCGLNKLEKRDDKPPGNIYSTLKRPQVETKIDVSYEYRFLEFTTLGARRITLTEPAQTCTPLPSARVSSE
ncbi:hypothetical protein MC885_012198 [Smutsia gigantea]|nr:hypothetical protein MC885_012198 [Smutsia gigantea]